MLALTIILGAAAAFAFFGWWRDNVNTQAVRIQAKNEAMAVEIERIRTSNELRRRIAEARRLLSDKRCHGRIDATRGARESERDRWMEATK